MTPITQQQALEALDRLREPIAGVEQIAQAFSTLRSFILQHGDAAEGPSDAVGAAMRRWSITDIDFAVEVAMKKEPHHD